MTLKTISTIALIILSLIFIIELIGALPLIGSGLFWYSFGAILNMLTWLPFILFFWKVYQKYNAA